MSRDAEPVDVTNVVEKLAEDEKTTNVYSFPADAPPAAKAQTAAKQTSKTAAGLEKSSLAGTLVADVDDPNASRPASAESRITPKEIIEKATAFEAPNWVRVGWQRFVGDPDKPEGDVFDSFLGDLYYGQMWTNAAAIFIAVFGTWLLTKLGFSIAWVVILCAFLGKVLCMGCVSHARSNCIYRFSNILQELDESLLSKRT
jgi:hypothetical protein